MAYAGSSLAGIALPVVALFLASSALAQGVGMRDGSREVLLGTSTLGGAPATINQEAQAYYDAAEREQKLGRPDAAQRRLEQLVARYPQAAIADVARHDLIALYARLPTKQADQPERYAALADTAVASPSQPTSQPLSNTPLSRLGAPHPNDLTTASIPPSNAPTTGWQTQTNPAKVDDRKSTDGLKRPARTAQDTFRQAAGDLVFFSDGSAELGTRARRVLEAQTEWLLAQPGARVTIEGHADDSAGASDNQRLSEARAKAVHDRLVEAGIEASRLTVVAVGTNRRVATCGERGGDPACAAQNRRVVTVIAPSSVIAAAASGRVAPQGQLPWDTASPTPRPTPR
jgi:outer membrane protein OmpA-like peptidoglycan-associated protein